jgi:hypothetical protein
MNRNVTVDITPAGNVVIEANGFQGCGCTKATEQIELVLGGGARKRTPKPEMHAPASTAQTTKLTF